MHLWELVVYLSGAMSMKILNDYFDILLYVIVNDNVIVSWKINSIIYSFKFERYDRIR